MTLVPLVIVILVENHVEVEGGLPLYDRRREWPLSEVIIVTSGV